MNMDRMYLKKLVEFSFVKYENGEFYCRVCDGKNFHYGNCPMPEIIKYLDDSGKIVKYSEHLSDHERGYPLKPICECCLDEDGEYYVDRAWMCESCKKDYLIDHPDMEELIAKVEYMENR